MAKRGRPLHGEHRIDKSRKVEHMLRAGEVYGYWRVLRRAPMVFNLPENKPDGTPRAQHRKRYSSSAWYFVQCMCGKTATMRRSDIQACKGRKRCQHAYAAVTHVDSAVKLKLPPEYGDNIGRFLADNSLGIGTARGHVQEMLHQPALQPLAVEDLAGFHPVISRLSADGYSSADIAAALKCREESVDAALAIMGVTK